MGPAVQLPGRLFAQFTVGLNLFGFFAVALLSGSLANSVRSAGAQLDQASTEIADLQALNRHVIDSGLATLIGAARGDVQPGRRSDRRRADPVGDREAHRRGAAAAVGVCRHWRAIDQTRREVEFRHRAADGRGN
jgi:hypothetical protein